MSGADEVTSYDPKNGKKLWSVPGTALTTCGTIVWDGDVVFASGGWGATVALVVGLALLGAVLVVAYSSVRRSVR